MHQHHWRSHTRFARRSEEHWANETKSSAARGMRRPCRIHALELRSRAVHVRNLAGRSAPHPRSGAYGPVPLALTCARELRSRLLWVCIASGGDSRAGALGQCLVRRCEVPQRLRGAQALRGHSCMCHHGLQSRCMLLPL